MREIHADFSIQPHPQHSVTRNLALVRYFYIFVFLFIRTQGLRRIPPKPTLCVFFIIIMASMYCPLFGIATESDYNIACDCTIKIIREINPS